MLKRRLIPVLFIKNGFIVRSEQFQQHKIIGNVVNAVRRFNEWDIDELVYIDISRTQTYDSKRDDHKIERVTSIDEILALVSKECFMPLTFGGGIRDFDTIHKLLNNGADKIIVNTILHEKPKDVQKAIRFFGCQAIVACIDFIYKNGQFSFFTRFGTNKLELSKWEMAKTIQRLGCGEVFLNNISRDGTGDGYDIAALSELESLFSVPVVACGGAMATFDFIEIAENTHLSGIAAGNMFHFTENSYPRSKAALKEKGYNFR